MLRRSRAICFFVIACDNLIFRKFPVSQISPFSCVINPLTPRGTRCFCSSQVSPPYITNGGVPSDDAACIERTYYIARDSAVTHFTNNVFGLVVNWIFRHLPVFEYISDIYMSIVFRQSMDPTNIDLAGFCQKVCNPDFRLISRITKKVYR